MKARSWSFFALALLVGAACIRLGQWQLSRLQERRARNGEIEYEMALPSADLCELAGQSAELPPYRRVTAAGRFDPDHEIVLTARSFNEQPGVHLVTPLRPQAGCPAVLVDRGWIPFEESAPPARRRYATLSFVVIEGVLFPSQQEPAWDILADPTSGPGGEPLEAWRVLNTEGIGAQVPYPLQGVYLAQTEPLEGGGVQPRIDAEIDLTEGPHLGYAIQWFAFAAIAFIGGGYWLYRNLPR